MPGPLRIRLAKALLGSSAKSFVPPLFDDREFPGGGPGAPLRTYASKREQLAANVGLSYTANNAITEAASAIQLKIGRRNNDGDIEEAFDKKAEELRELIANPNNVHSGEQLMDLHYGYRNFTGEAYTLMLRDGGPWTPVPGQLPHALQELPAHEVQFDLSKAGYSNSLVRYNGLELPVTMFIRDIKPNPSNPYFGISVISAAAAMLNSDEGMRAWNNHLMQNSASPSLIFTSEEPMDDDAYTRWKAQFTNDNTGVLNSGKPLLIEGGDAKPFTMTPKDLDFLKSRDFTNDEILMMWRVNPYIIGAVKDVNLATAKAARIQHAEINIEPRVRQWVRQLQVTMVNVFDPELIVYYDPIVPEDDTAKLAYHQAAVNKWETIDEARAAYGDQPLENGLGDQLYVPNTTETLESAAEGQAPASSDGSPAAEPAGDDGGTSDPAKNGKSLAGVKKKT